MIFFFLSKLGNVALDIFNYITDAVPYFIIYDNCQSVVHYQCIILPDSETPTPINKPSSCVMYEARTNLCASWCGRVPELCIQISQNVAQK